MRDSKRDTDVLKSLLDSVGEGGMIGRMVLKYVCYHVRNELPVYVLCRIQHVWGWCTGMIQRDDMGWEEGLCTGTHVHLWWIHVNVWQNQYSILK